MGRWTGAGPLGTMTFADEVPCQGAGHAIVAPAAGVTAECRNAYTAVCASGRKSEAMALSVVSAVSPLLDPARLRLAVDDSPTKRYGPQVEGAGIHHNPTPGPAGEEYLYGHNWVSLAALAGHPDRGTLALPIHAELYVRR